MNTQPTINVETVNAPTIYPETIVNYYPDYETRRLFKRRTFRELEKFAG
ncbi:MAG: hypothetical protein ABJA66_04715 [Actinomycetota bacterium]